MNLAGLVATLMAGEGFNGLMVRVREFAAGERDAYTAEQWQAELADRHASGWTVIDMTGRRNVEPIDPAELAATMAAANASTVEGRRAAMQARSADEGPGPAHSLDPYAYVDLVRKREHRPALAITNDRILD